MAKSIIILLIIGATFALVADIFANVMRVAEIREIKRNLRRFESAFYQFRKEQKKESPGDLVELIIKEEKDTPLKFGDF